MAGIENRVELSLEENDPQYHLPGDDMVHGDMFTYYTLSALNSGESGDKSRRHVLNLPDLAGSLEEIDQLTADGWQQAVFVGKLMTSSRESERIEIEDTRKSNKKSMSDEGIHSLAKRKAGFTTGLFVVQPILEYRREVRHIVDTLPAQSIPHLVAGTHQDGSRTLRVIPEDREEYHYGEHLGQRSKDPSVLEEKSWRTIEALHDMFYSQAVDLITQKDSGPDANL